MKELKITNSDKSHGNVIVFRKNEVIRVNGDKYMIKEVDISDDEDVTDIQISRIEEVRD